MSTADAAKTLLRAGWPPEAVAEVLDLHRATAYRYQAEIRDEARSVQVAFRELRELLAG